MTYLHNKGKPFFLSQAQLQSRHHPFPACSCSKLHSVLSGRQQAVGLQTGHKGFLLVLHPSCSVLPLLCGFFMGCSAFKGKRLCLIHHKTRLFLSPALLTGSTSLLHSPFYLFPPLEQHSGMQNGGKG